jgi:hypothetical protein
MRWHDGDWLGRPRPGWYAAAVDVGDNAAKPQGRLTKRHTARNARVMGQIIQVSEETLLADIVRRLVDEFPHVSPMVVDTLIRKEHARFEASRIRDFVPLLVQKHARRELRSN